MDLTARETVDMICKALAEKKATDIKIIEVATLTDVADYFVICSAKSTTTVRALFDNLDEGMSKLGFEPKHKMPIILRRES